jgi:tol-pal system protein YbgF
MCLAVSSTAYAADEDTTKRLADMQQQLNAVTARLAVLEKQPQASSLLTLQSQIDALKSVVEDLRGQSEVHAHDIETTQKRQTDLYQDLDARLRNMVRTDATATTATSAPPTASGVVSKSDAKPDVKADGDAEEHSYQAALTLFRQGDYVGASTGFKQFLKTYPKSNMAASAQYWIGNAYFSTKDFKNALITQQKLVSTYPNSSKVPDALLNISSAQIELGDMDGARKTLELIVNKYSATAAAGLAKKRLALFK